TNPLPWDAVRDTQGDQTASAPPAGSYSGSSAFGTRAVVFYASAHGSHIQVVALAAAPACTPAKSFGVNEPHFASIAINADGSFKIGRASCRDRVYTSAQVTYTLSRHFIGATAAGQLREDVTFNDGTAYSCTTT